jgi:hypothetical protein
MRIEERWPNQTVRRGLGKSQHGGASWGWLRGTGWWRAGLWLCAARGVGPRDRSCTRRDRSGGGAIALTRWKERLLRSSARYGPVPLLHHFSGGIGQRAFAEREWDGFVWGQAGGKWGFGCVRLVGVASRDRSCTRRDRSGGGAIALTRFGGFVATIQCSFRPCPAAALFFWGVGQRAFAERGMGGIWCPQKPLPP